MLSLLLYLWFHLTTSLTQTETTINAQTAQSGTTDVSISLNSHSVAIANTNYYVNVQTQDAYDIKLSLSPKYSFDSHYNSSLTLTINGNTPFPNADGDLLIVFSVGNLQYFSFFLHLDTNSIRSRIYPSVTLSKNINNVSEWIYDTITYPQRWHRISNNDQWKQLNQWRNQALWPLKFTIENNPIQQISNFKFFHDIQNTNILAVSYTFNSAFLGNKNMDIYIMGDSKNEQFIISSFNILSENSKPTFSPTNQPSIIPSIIPTKSPTFSPLYHVVNTINSDNKLDKNNESENDNAHILIFTILISSATFVVIIQICCMIKKRIKKKYFQNNIAKKQSGYEHKHTTIPTQSHIEYNINDNEISECKHQTEILTINNDKKNRKDTTSTTERFEFNLDGRRTQVNDHELKRPNSETVTVQHNAYGHPYIYGQTYGKKNYFYEGIQGINDDIISNGDTVSVGITTTNEFDKEEESACALMDEKTVNQYWKKHVNVQFISRNDNGHRYEMKHNC